LLLLFCSFQYSFFFHMFSALSIICLGIFLFWSWFLFFSLVVWKPRVCGCPFLFGKISAIILLTKLSMPLVCISPPSSIPLVYRLGVLMCSRSLTCSTHVLLVFFIVLIDLILLLYFQSPVLYFQPAQLYW
jgi:hypothetical protein